MFFLLACTSLTKPISTDEGPVDLRLDPNIVEGEDFLIQSPDYVIPAFTDTMMCFWGTWTEPTVGIEYFEWMQSPGFGHHTMFNVSEDSPEDFPDGTWMDCTVPKDAPMQKTNPLVQGTEVVEPTHGRMVLPEGKAVRVTQGQRWILQSHYLNSSDQDILVRDLAWGRLLPEEEVEDWVGVFAFNNSSISLPPQKETVAGFDCSWGTAVNILTMASHMHEQGLSIYGDLYRESGSIERIYEQTEWDPEWRDAPQFVNYGDGLPVAANDHLRGHCTWFNTTDETLEFPTEMCVLMGMAWPLEAPLSCDNAYPVSE